MNNQLKNKKTYKSPNLIIYGDFQALTLSGSRSAPGYDAFQSIKSGYAVGEAGFTVQKTGRVCPPNKAADSNCGYQN